MRINVTGECPTAKVVRGYLSKHDFHLTDHDPDWIIHIEEPAGAAIPSLDGRGGELEQAILRHLRRQSVTAIEVHTGRTVSSEREIRILVPASDIHRQAVETGVFRGVLETAKQNASDIPSPARWWRAMLQRKTK
jgi:hypothetical protein